jgi:hypothetical protein
MSNTFEPHDVSSLVYKLYKNPILWNVYKIMNCKKTQRYQ